MTSVRGVRVEKAEKKVKKERKREENLVQVEEPKKERARDKKAKKPAAQGDAACVEAFKTIIHCLSLRQREDCERFLCATAPRSASVL